MIIETYYKKIYSCKVSIARNGQGIRDMHEGDTLPILKLFLKFKTSNLNKETSVFILTLLPVTIHLLTVCVEKKIDIQIRVK